VALNQGFKDLPTKLWKTLVISHFSIS
jgi:hypothetical protein